MGLIDLSTNASSKKHVDFNDARYQLADKLKTSGKENIRSTFTLYDNKEQHKVAVQDITAAYALSDKKIPIGEILNKMLDLIVDMEDNVLDTEKDAIYAWRYSVALLQMCKEKEKRQETLRSFDNGLKNSVINSKTFIEQFPGKYTNRTNFFDNKIKNEMANDIASTFKDIALPKIHDTAIEQSRRIAEKHSNPILDKIVHWAIENYKCSVDSFFDIKKNDDTGLFYSVNTIILHLKNGYDMSIIGTVGTDRDDQFAMSILNANDLTMKKHDERIGQDDVKSSVLEAVMEDPVDPLTKLLTYEKKKNELLKQQFSILKDTRPMIPSEALALKAAESVVGRDYIWGCEQFRKSHEDLPADFKLSDVQLPIIEEYEREDELTQSLTDVTNSIDNSKQEVIEENELIQEQKEPVVELIAEEMNLVKEIEETSEPSPEIEHTEVLFEEIKPKQEQVPPKPEFSMPILTQQPSQTTQNQSPTTERDFDMSATLLPGFIPSKKVEEQVGTSFTQEAKPMPSTMLPENKTQLFKPVVEAKTDVVSKKEEPQESEELSQPELLLDNLDSLFD